MSAQSGNAEAADNSALPACTAANLNTDAQSAGKGFNGGTFADAREADVTPQVRVETEGQHVGKIGVESFNSAFTASDNYEGS